MTDTVTDVVSPGRARSLANLRPPWQKGECPNPIGGQVSAYHRARSICAKATDEAVLTQIELMRSDDDRVRFMATEAVLKRGAGVPRDHSGEESAASGINLARLSPDQQRSLADLLSLVLGTPRTIDGTSGGTTEG